jgi:hypothetical protein
MQPSTAEHKDRLHRTFIAALERLDKQNREPDRWEEECLSYALGAMASGLYPAAGVELAAFSRPVAERSPTEMVALENKPSRFTKAMLRAGIDFVIRRAIESPAVANDDSLPPASHLAVRSFLGASL